MDGTSARETVRRPGANRMETDHFVLKSLGLKAWSIQAPTAQRLSKCVVQRSPTASAWKRTKNNAAEEKVCLKGPGFWKQLQLHRSAPIRRYYDHCSVQPKGDGCQASPSTFVKFRVPNCDNCIAFYCIYKQACECDAKFANALWIARASHTELSHPWGDKGVAQEQDDEGALRSSAEEMIGATGPYFE